MKISIFFLFLLLFLLISYTGAYADVMTGGNYILQLGPSPAKRVKKVSFHSMDSILATRRFLYPFMFSLSTSTIDFGILYATNPITRVVKLQVTNPAGGSYIVTASENHDLLSRNNTFIPNTRCDTGFCSATTPGVWDSSLTYGFGYRCSSDDSACDTDFLSNNTFKTFPQSNLNQPDQIVMKGGIIKSASSKITFKVNISGSQPEGTYLNLVTFIAVPSY